MFCPFRFFASLLIVCSRKLFQCYLLTLLLHLVRLCQIADFYFPVSGRTLVLQIIRNNYGCFGESRSVLPVCSAAIRCFERCHRWRFIPFPCYGAENLSFPLPCDKSFCCVPKPAGITRPALLLPFYWMPWLLIFLCCIVRNFWCHNRENWLVFFFVVTRNSWKQRIASYEISIPDYPASLSFWRAGCVLFKRPYYCESDTRRTTFRQITITIPGLYFPPLACAYGSEDGF